MDSINKDVVRFMNSNDKQWLEHTYKNYLFAKDLFLNPRSQQLVSFTYVLDKFHIFVGELVRFDTRLSCRMVTLHEVSLEPKQSDEVYGRLYFDEANKRVLKLIKDFETEYELTH